MRLCNVQLPAVITLITAFNVSIVHGSLGVIAFTKPPSSCRRGGVAANFLAKKDVVVIERTGFNDGAADLDLDAINNANGRVKKKKVTTAKRKKSTESEPNYWPDEDDPFVVVANGEVYATGIDSANEDGGRIEANVQQIQNIDGNRKSIKFTIRGNPRVLIRHRTARGFMYNPSRAMQDLFRDCLLELLPRKFHPTIIDEKSVNGDDDDDDDDIKPIVLFPQDDFLKMSITFRMKRPKSHFVGNKPGPGRLKPSAPGKLYKSSRSDVDNLAKFVMDSLNGLVYADDRQVVHLNAIKVLDCEGGCMGGTDVEISAVEEEDMM